MSGSGDVLFTHFEFGFDLSSAYCPYMSVYVHILLYIIHIVNYHPFFTTIFIYTLKIRFVVVLFQQFLVGTALSTFGCQALRLGSTAHPLVAGVEATQSC